MFHLSDKPMDSYGSLVWKPPTSHRISYHIISYHIISTYLISTLHSPGHPWKPHVSRHNPGFTEPTICSWPAPRKHDLKISGYLSGGQWCTDGWTWLFCWYKNLSSKIWQLTKIWGNPSKDASVYSSTHEWSSMCISKLATPQVARIVTSTSPSTHVVPNACARSVLELLLPVAITRPPGSTFEGIHDIKQVDIIPKCLKILNFKALFHYFC